MNMKRFFAQTVLLLVFFTLSINYSSAQTGIWTQKADFGGNARHYAVGFSIGTKGYIGTGHVSLNATKDFWEYDPSNNTWTQKANFGGTARDYAVGFSIGTKGYIGSGYNSFYGSYYYDFWEYDPSTNIWTQKADFGGGSRNSAIGFSIGTKGYIGTGVVSSYMKDFWEYDPILDKWTQKADFGGTARSQAVGFSIGTKGYIGTGYDGSYKNDFWEYDSSLDKWTQKADFSGTARKTAVGYSIGTKGYIGTGASSSVLKEKDLWEYDPSTNTWIRKADFGGTARSVAVGFSTVTKGYIGTGFDNTQSRADFWECNPSQSPLTGTFSLSVPANGAYASPIQTFAWASASGASFYQLYIDGKLVQDNITNKSYQLTAQQALIAGMHTWYVMGNGNTQSNETWSFRVDATPPNVFNLTSPANNVWTTNAKPVFAWSAATDAASGMAKYQLWIDGALYKENILTTTTTYTPTSDLLNGLHTWFVKAFDNVGNERISTQTWTIKIDNLPPISCTLKAPLSNQYIKNNMPTFTWSSSKDAGIGFKNFQLYIDNSLLKDNLSDSSFTSINPLSYGQHSWYVKGFDSLANNQSSISRQFYIDNKPPVNFKLKTPLDSAIVDLPTPNLSWNATLDSAGGIGLSKYQLWINGKVDKDSIQIGLTTTSPKNALDQGAYTWYVKAYDKLGNVKQSNNQIFYVDWEYPLDFSLSLPSDNQTVYSCTPLFKWNPSSDIGSGLLRYELVLSDYPVVKVSSKDTAVVFPQNLPNGQYTWFVKAYDRAGNFTSSPVYNLIVDASHFTVDGIVSYDNSSNTLMSNVQLKLKNQYNEVIATTTTDISGYYKFENLNNGTYSIEPSTTRTPGNIDATDALLINKNFVKLYTFPDNLRKKAADVNGDNNVNSTDGLFISKYFVKIITSFTAGKWYYEPLAFTINCQNATLNIKAICIGDASGGFKPNN